LNIVLQMKDNQTLYANIKPPQKIDLLRIEDDNESNEVKIGFIFCLE
jgi:hypothetical protein